MEITQLAPEEHKPGDWYVCATSSHYFISMYTKNEWTQDERGCLSHQNFWFPQLTLIHLISHLDAQLPLVVNFYCKMGHFLPSSPLFLLSFFRNLPWWRTSGQALLEAPGGAMNCTRPSLSKALLGRSYAGVHSCFSLYFLLILVNRTPWVIYIPFKLIREWSQMNNYLNFLFCPEGVTQCFIYIFIYSGEDSWRKEMSGQHQGNPCLWERVGFEHHGLWTGPFEPERHCNFLPLWEFLLQSLRDLRQFCGYLYKIHC